MREEPRIGASVKDEGDIPGIDGIAEGDELRVAASVEDDGDMPDIEGCGSVGDPPAAGLIPGIEGIAEGGAGCCAGLLPVWGPDAARSEGAISNSAARR
jgi:hypothetical protein